MSLWQILLVIVAMHCYAAVINSKTSPEALDRIHDNTRAVYSNRIKSKAWKAAEAKHLAEIHNLEFPLDTVQPTDFDALSFAVRRIDIETVRATLADKAKLKLRLHRNLLGNLLQKAVSLHTPKLKQVAGLADLLITYGADVNLATEIKETYLTPPAPHESDLESNQSSEEEFSDDEDFTMDVQLSTGDNSGLLNDLAEASNMARDTWSTKVLVRSGGRTLLMTAAERQNPFMIKLLLQKGADKHATDARGNTALDFLESGVPTDRMEECYNLLV